MIDLDKASNTVDKADGFFNNLNRFIRNHPIWFILILLGGFVYWGSTLPEEVADEVILQQEQSVIRDTIYITPEEVAQLPETEHVVVDEPEYYITKKTFLVDDFGYRKGDTVYIDYYSDGVVEKYYSDNLELYYPNN